MFSTQKSLQKLLLPAQLLNKVSVFYNVIEYFPFQKVWFFRKGVSSSRAIYLKADGVAFPQKTPTNFSFRRPPTLAFRSKAEEELTVTLFV